MTVADRRIFRPSTSPIPGASPTFNAVKQIFSGWEFVQTDGGNQAVDSAAFNAAAAKGKDLMVLPSRSGSPYLLNGVTSGENVGWNFVSGAYAHVEGPVTINGFIDAPLRPVFHVTPIDPATETWMDSLLKVRSSNTSGGYLAGETVALMQVLFRPDWFVPLGGNASDWGAKAQLAFQVGGHRSVCEFGAGFYETYSSIVLDQNKYGENLVLSGQGFHQTHMHIMYDSTDGIIGINGDSSGEAEVRDLKINELSGNRNCVCILVGGTSMKVRDSWFGNSAYGILQPAGSGARLVGNFVENCLYNRVISPRIDLSAGRPSQPGVTAVPAIVGDYQDAGVVIDLIEEGNMYFSAAANDLLIERTAGTLSGINMKNIRSKNSGLDAIKIDMVNPAGSDGLQIDAYIRAPGGYAINTNNCDLVFSGMIDDPGSGVGVNATGDSIVNLNAVTMGNRVGAQTMTRFATSGNGVVNDVNPMSLR